MSNQFDPEKHCGAKTRSGQSCKNPKGFRVPDYDPNGTNHRCYLHGGITRKSKGKNKEKTEEGDRRMAEKKRKTGLYASVLTSTDRVFYDRVDEFSPDDILLDNFKLIQGRLLGLVSGETGKLDGWRRKVMDAAEALFDLEEIDEMQIKELRLILLNLDVSRLAGVMNQTVGLLQGAKTFSKAGEIEKQNELLKKFLVDAIRIGDREVKLLALNTIQTMKLDAGMNSDELDRMIAEARRNDNETVDVAIAGDDE